MTCRLLTRHFTDHHTCVYSSRIHSSTGPLIRNRDTGPVQISYLRKGVFHINFSTTAPEVFVSPEMQAEFLTPCGALSNMYSSSSQHNMGEASNLSFSETLR